MKDVKKILIVFFPLLGWRPVFLQTNRLNEWRSKTHLEIFLTISQVLTGDNLSIILCRDLYNLCSSAFWTWKFRKRHSDIQLLFEMDCADLD